MELGCSCPGMLPLAIIVGIMKLGPPACIRPVEKCCPGIMANGSGLPLLAMSWT